MEKPARAAVLCLSALTRLARANVLGDVAALGLGPLTNLELARR